MNLHEEITKTAYELYKKRGCIEGRDFDNWLDAERTVLARHASQEIEEPAIITEEGITEEIEEKELRHLSRKIEEEPTVIKEIETKEPVEGISGKIEKGKPAKRVAKGRKEVEKKESPKSGK